MQRLAVPSPPGQAARDGEPVPGHELDPALPRKVFDRLTALGRAAATRFSERRQLSRLSPGIGEFGWPIVCRGRGEG